MEGFRFAFPEATAKKNPINRTGPSEKTNDRIRQQPATSLIDWRNAPSRNPSLLTDGKRSVWVWGGSDLGNACEERQPHRHGASQFTESNVQAAEAMPQHSNYPNVPQKWAFRRCWVIFCILSISWRTLCPALKTNTEDDPGRIMAKVRKENV